MRLESAEVVEEAEQRSRRDSREKGIASEILRVLSENETTVVEAITCLRLAEDAIKQVRISIAHSS